MQALDEISCVGSENKSRPLALQMRLFGGVIFGPEAAEIQSLMSESPYTSAEDDSEWENEKTRKRRFAAKQVTFVSSCKMPTKRGEFILRAYRSETRLGFEPVVMVVEKWKPFEAVHVRVHDQCQTSEVLGSMRCDCKEQLDYSLQFIHTHGGAVIYLPQEGRGIGLANKVAAYSLQDDGYDTVDANRKLGFEDDERSYECVPAILKDMGIKTINLMTNNPFKVESLKKLGVHIANRTPIVMACNKHNQAYIETKAKRMGHLINEL
mmetsp:Transcript_15779/g.23483  ORF Transcript_15779/g.23483 Transcript_15779/m.23483 type:complete len:266 (+) Transcript_15779:184-981(+)|eukprot:CAMPEP_0171452034 /NCGR_PEP_ID=MMETSP0945-20130129/298_1 /TAXON_ID=109269 /ORGANISM="Vaucheria litorea, Strain CCMP2940" /LENGTH=265 /DNA_ID=CAMNT_0011976609 /DNA_START=182 /DNA_END=979 /DNA_ORIENTATION=+